MGQDRLDDMSVVVDAELIGHGQQQRVRLGDGFVRLELFDQCIRLGGVAAAEDRPRPLVDEPDLVLALAFMSEIGAIAIVDQREDAAADRNPWLARMAGLLLGGAVGADLGRLLDVESFAGLVVLER